MNYPSDIAFSDSVKRVQAARGSREAYARVEQRGWQTTVTAELAAFIADMDSFYLATASASGQPYIQHRGGPRGFLHVIDDRTLGFADFSGNRQYITTGNLAENDQAFIFLMDYYNRRRIKLWGHARIVNDDDALLASLAPQDYKARVEQAVLFSIATWDVNCPQHIPEKVPAPLVAQAFAQYEDRIAALQREIDALRMTAP